MKEKIADLAIFPEGIRLNARRELLHDPRNDVRPYFPGQRFTWERGFFTVPISVSEERVELLAHRYMQRWGQYLETPQPYGPGFKVLLMEEPCLDTGVVARAVDPPDRKRYSLWAKVTRTPVNLHVEVPDEDVALYLASGYKLRE